MKLDKAPDGSGAQEGSRKNDPTERLPGIVGNPEIGANILRRMESINYIVENATGFDYAELKAGAEGKISGDEEQAIEGSLRILQSLKAVTNQAEILQRATRNIFEIGVAKEALNRLAQEQSLSKNAKHIVAAVEHLYDAVGLLTSPEVQKELYRQAGGMSEAEVAEAKERVQRMSSSNKKE